MSILSKLFGGGSAPEPEPETYNDFRIFPEPKSDARRIPHRGPDREGDRRRDEIPNFLRADICQSREEAERLTILKARQIIDEQGERMFT
jgi:hypothetical protein